MKPILIGVSGNAGVGKDTTADILVKHFGFTKVSFADELKRTAMRWYGFTVEQLWGPSEMRNTPSPKYPHLICRDVLQKLGTEVGRHIEGMTWVNITLGVVEELISDDRLTYSYAQGIGMAMSKMHRRGVVISDVRWPAGNEGRAIKDAGGKLVRIIRHDAKPLDVNSAGHPSEANVDVSQDIFDFSILNVTEQGLAKGDLPRGLGLAVATMMEKIHG